MAIEEITMEGTAAEQLAKQKAASKVRALKPQTPPPDYRTLGNQATRLGEGAVAKEDTLLNAARNAGIGEETGGLARAVIPAARAATGLGALLYSPTAGEGSDVTPTIYTPPMGSSNASIVPDVRTYNKTGSGVIGTDNNQLGSSITAGQTSLQSGSPEIYSGFNNYGIAKDINAELDKTNAISPSFDKPIANMPDKGIGITQSKPNSYLGLGEGNYSSSTQNPEGIQRASASFNAAGQDIKKLGDQLPTYDSKTYNDTVSKQLQHDQGMARLRAGLPYDAAEANQILNRGPTFSSGNQNVGHQGWFGDPREREAVIEAKKGNIQEAALIAGLGGKKEEQQLKEAALGLKAQEQAGQLALGREKNAIDRQTAQANLQKLGFTQGLELNKEAFKQQQAKDRFELDSKKYNTQTANQLGEMDFKIGQEFAKAESMAPGADRNATIGAAINAYTALTGSKQTGTLRAALQDPQAKPLVEKLQELYNTPGIAEGDPRITQLQSELLKINPGYNGMFKG